MLGGLGAPELMLILVIVLILFGAGRLPQVFESFGKGMKSFRDAQKEDPIDVTQTEASPGKPKAIAHDPLADAEEIKAKEEERVRRTG